MRLRYFFQRSLSNIKKVYGNINPAERVEWNMEWKIISMRRKFCQKQCQDFSHIIKFGRTKNLTMEGKVTVLKLTGHGILIYLCSVDQSKSFSQLIVFSQCFFNRFCPMEKCGVTLHCLYRD